MDHDDSNPMVRQERRELRRRWVECRDRMRKLPNLLKWFIRENDGFNIDFAINSMLETPREMRRVAAQRLSMRRSKLEPSKVVPCSALVSLLARWSEKHAAASKEANDLRNSDDFGYHLAKRDTLADCIYDLRRAIRAGKKANAKLMGGTPSAPDLAATASVLSHAAPGSETSNYSGASLAESEGAGGDSNSKHN